MPTVLIHDSGPIRTLTLNRPERRNALTPEMQDELIAALETLPGSVRVVVLTGAGESFCAGLDLGALQGMQDQSAEELSEGARRIARMFELLYALPVPTIAAVNGHAIAGGTGLATLCDFTLAIPEAKFGYTEVRIGFVPALVSAYLQLQVGEKQARNLLLTGRLFAASEALTLGLVTEIVALDVLMSRAGELAATLLKKSPGSLRATKALIAAQNQPWLDAALAAALSAQTASRTTADFREGIAAFLEKRSPVWE